MEEIRRTFELKFKPHNSEELNWLFDEFGKAVKYVLDDLKRIYDSYQKILEPKEGKCDHCGDQMQLKWQNKIGYKICNRCYLYFFNYFYTTKKEYLDDLREQFPKLGTNIHSGYFNGVAKFAPQAFKSWIKKNEEREKEIERLELELQTEEDQLRQIKIRKKLQFKNKGIKDIEFRRNIIYMGTANMIDFKEENGKYWLGITSPFVKKEKIWFEFKLGKKEDYQTEHNKYQLVKDAIENKTFKIVHGKLIRKDNYFALMFPKKDISNSLTNRKEIIKLYKNNPKIPIVSFSFGIKRPLSVSVFINNKLVEKKIFGSGYFWNYINRERDYRAKVMKVFAKRYQSKWKRNKAKKRFFRKRNFCESNRIKYITHNLTTKVMQHLEEKYPECIILIRDTKGIKKINYPSTYRVILNRWNINFQKDLLDYKQRIKNFHIYLFKYKETNNLTCSKCQEKEDTKILTVKLNHASNREKLYRHRIKILQEKITKLEKYKDKKKHEKFIKQTEQELKYTKEKLEEIECNQKYPMKKFTCDQCGYQEDFYFNDCNSLYHLFHAHSLKDESN